MYVYCVRKTTYAYRKRKKINKNHSNYMKIAKMMSN